MPFLISLFFGFFATSCTLVPSPARASIDNPPQKNFVKIYKSLKITKCNKKTAECETKLFTSTGSGLIIYLIPEYVTVLSAGHVCDSVPDLKKENEEYSFSWDREIKILNWENKLHPAKIISTNQLSKTTADLCSLLVPSMDPKNYKKIKMAARPPKPGESIYYMGAPWGIYHPPTCLIEKGIFSGEIDTSSSLSTIFAAPGASGSAVLSMNHEIYGVLFAVHPAFMKATIITNYNKTKQFLLDSKKKIRNISPQ